MKEKLIMGKWMQVFLCMGGGPSREVEGRRKPGKHIQKCVNSCAALHTCHDFSSSYYSFASGNHPSAVATTFHAFATLVILFGILVASIDAGFGTKAKGRRQVAMYRAFHVVAPSIATICNNDATQLCTSSMHIVQVCRHIHIHTSL